MVMIRQELPRTETVGQGVAPRHFILDGKGYRPTNTPPDHLPPSATLGLAQFAARTRARARPARAPFRRRTVRASPGESLGTGDAGGDILSFRSACLGETWNAHGNHERA